MKTRLLLILSLAGTAFGLAVSALTREGRVSTEGAGRFDPTSLNFGNVRQAETLAGSLMFTNHGAGRIRITGIQSTCSCTVAGEHLMGAVLTVGESREVPVRMKTGLHDGPISSRIDLYYAHEGEATDSSLAVGVVAAEVLPDFRITPQLLDFGKCAEPIPPPRTFTVRAEHVDGMAVAIKGVASTSRFFKPRVVGRESVDPEATIEVAFDGTGLNQKESISGAITIRLDSERTPELMILARAKIDPPVEISPSALVLLSGDPAAPSTIAIRTVHPSRVEDASGLPGYASVAVDRLAVGTEHVLTVSLGQAAPPSFDAELRIQARLWTPDGKSVVKSAAVPVHRLAAQ